MRWISYRMPDGSEAVGMAAAGGYRGLSVAELGADLLTLVTEGKDAQARAAQKLASCPVIAADVIIFLPVLPRPQNIMFICL